jgi:hypothetical protein
MLYAVHHRKRAHTMRVFHVTAMVMTNLATGIDTAAPSRSWSAGVDSDLKVI